jgi:competence ComEA-like helix-hairpin-helix protein
VRLLARVLLIAATVLTASPAPAAGRVNVNAATAAELASVPGIDARLAARIVAYRKANTFRSYDDLLRVPGFTKLTLAKTMDHIEIGPPPARSRLLDLNRASFAELLLLKGVSPRTAKAIVDYREANGAFRSTRDLERVPGMDRRTLALILPQVRVRQTRRTPRPTPTAVVRRTPRPTPRPTAVAVIPTATPRPTTAPEATPVAVLPDGRINLNEANLRDLLRLPRMTPEAAREILAWREQHGPFLDPHDLIKVPLFGEAAYHRLKERIVVQ